MSRNFITRIVVITIALGLVGDVAMASASTAATSGRYITVSAEGSVKVIPDAVRLNATVSVVLGTSTEALAATSTSSAAVRAALVANGVATRDIATQSLTIYPEYSYTPDKSPVIIGYRGSQSFDVIIHNAKSAGMVVDAVVSAGGNQLQLNGVTPFVIDSTKATSSARTNAVKNAKVKASSYASLLGEKLGKVNYLIETSSPTLSPPPMRYAAAVPGATQVDLGQQDVTVSITIQWALR